jgi:NitT/TauT family transport system ATP-binding protein
MVSDSDYIVLDNVTKQFPRRGESPLDVINGLSLQIERGSLVSILGPSGSGKSTLLNLMNGLDDVTSGSIRVNGKVVSRGSRSDTKIGVAFQTPRLLNWRSVRDNIKVPLVINGVPKKEAEQRVEHYLDLVGLAEFARYYPLQLSGGMQQRVSLARGLALEPDLLLADEPFSALDEITATKLRAELVEMWQATGRTIIFVTHNIREAVFLSSRVLVVTARPCRLHVDLPITVPHPRDLQSDELFQIEKQVVAQFNAMGVGVGVPA